MMPTWQPSGSVVLAREVGEQPARASLKRVSRLIARAPASSTDHRASMARPRTIVVSLLLQRAASFGYFPGSAMSEPGSAADPLHIACGYDYSMNGPGSNHYYYLDGGNAGSTVSINTCGSSQDLMIQVYESSATFDAIADGSMDWGSYASNNYGDAVINQDLSLIHI